DDIRSLVEQRFRLGHGRVVAALTHRFGPERVPVIENAVQDAYVRALERWAAEGIPSHPERWLVRVAHNAVVDALRRNHPSESLDSLHDVPADPPGFDSDDELRLMFLCCDASLTHAAQTALVLIDLRHHRLDADRGPIRLAASVCPIAGGRRQP